MTYYTLKDLKVSIYDNRNLIEIAAIVLNIKKDNITEFKILRRSLDLRHKDKDIFYVYTFVFALKCERPSYNKLEVYIPEKTEDFKIENKIELKHRPVIIGCGPAGLFCAHTFIEYGIEPIVLERGKRIAQRELDIDKFIADRIINSESNICYGEGGAGTFSDAKLTSRSKDARQNKVLSTFVKYGADESILYDNKPHLGTDVIKKVITNMTEYLISRGVDFRFNTKAENIVLRNNTISAVNGQDFELTTDTVILACGHSARDVYAMLNNIGAAMQAKPFAVGVRIEHKKEDIDRATYKQHYLKASLPAAEYILRYQDTSNKGVYTFCNCPGGLVIPCVTEEGMLCVNGMSYSKRDGENSNSAIVVTVDQKDFGSYSPLAGIEFQRKLEHNAYILGGANYSAPIMSCGDILKHSDDKGYDEVRASYLPGVKQAELHDCIPQNILNCIKNALIDFGRKLNGFDSSKAILTAIETRTSSPVKILRDENLQSINIKGLYLAGEGSGHAGGIVSSAIDGIKAAQGCMNILR